MDSGLCVRAYLGGRWLRRTAAVRTPIRTARRHACAGANSDSPSAKRNARAARCHSSTVDGEARCRRAGRDACADAATNSPARDTRNAGDTACGGDACAVS